MAVRCDVEMSANMPEFGSSRRLPLAVVRPQLTPERRDRRFKHLPERTVVSQPLAYLNVRVDGRETSYFEWLGAGIYCAGRRAAAQNGRSPLLQELQYGFSERFFYLRVDGLPGSFSGLRNFEFQITLRGDEELRLVVAIEEGSFAGCLLDTPGLCILGPHELVEVAFDRTLELAIGRRLIGLAEQTSFMLNVALCKNGLPVDVLPPDGSLEVMLGPEAFAWSAE